jgi:glycosyltransferase involved in cell wall biosynthesis
MHRGGDTNSSEKHYAFISVIPAYNPGDIVASIVSEVSKHVDAVIVVDDGSDRENKRYLEQCALLENVRLITFPANRGKGHALIAGLQEALKYHPDYIFAIDSDGQHDPKEIPKFKHLITTAYHPYDLIIGARQSITDMPLRSKIGNVFTARVFSALFNKSLDDTQSGFRVLSADFAKNVIASITPGRFETEMRILIYAVESNRTIGMVPIETIYFDKNKGSKFRPFQDSLRVLVPFSKYTGVAITSFLIDYSIFMVLSYLFGIYYLFAHLVSRICSGTFNFFANKHIVFKSKSGKLQEGIRYITAVLFSLLSTALLLYCFVDLIGSPKAIAKPVAEFTMFLVNFVILNKFVFNRKI